MFGVGGLRFCFWHVLITMMLVWFGYITFNTHPNVFQISGQVFAYVWGMLHVVAKIFAIILAYFLVGAGSGKYFLWAMDNNEDLAIRPTKYGDTAMRSDFMFHFWGWPLAFVCYVVCGFVIFLEWVWNKVPETFFGANTP